MKKFPEVSMEEEHHNDLMELGRTGPDDANTFINEVSTRLNKSQEFLMDNKPVKAYKTLEIIQDYLLKQRRIVIAHEYYNERVGKKK